MAGEGVGLAGVRRVAGVGQVEADGVADAAGEAAFQDEEAAVGEGLYLGDAEEGGVGLVRVLRGELEVVALGPGPGLEADVARVSPAIRYSIDARRVWPPGSRVRPSKVWLETARPAGATRSEDGTGRRSRILPSAE